MRQGPRTSSRTSNRPRDDSRAQYSASRISESKSHSGVAANLPPARAREAVPGGTRAERAPNSPFRHRLLWRRLGDDLSRSQPGRLGPGRASLIRTRSHPERTVGGSRSSLSAGLCSDHRVRAVLRTTAPPGRPGSSPRRCVSCSGNDPGRPGGRCRSRSSTTGRSAPRCSPARSEPGRSRFRRTSWGSAPCSSRGARDAHRTAS